MTKTTTPGDPDQNINKPNVRSSPVPQRRGGLEPTPQDRVIDYRRKMEPYWNGTIKDPYPASSDSLVPWYYRYSVPDLMGFHTSEEEADDITVVDVFNTNQELRLGEGSSTEPSSNDDRDSSGEDALGLEKN